MSQSRSGSGDYHESRGTRSRGDEPSSAGRTEDGDSYSQQRAYPDRTRRSENPRGAHPDAPSSSSRYTEADERGSSRHLDDDTRSEIPSAIGRLEDPSRATRPPRSEDTDDMPSHIGRLQDPKGSSRAARDEADIPSEVKRLQDPSGRSSHPPPEVDCLQDSRGPSAHADAPPASERSSKSAEGKSRSSRASLEDEIVHIDAQTWEGLKTSGKALLPFLAPECLMIFPGAAILDAKSTPSLREILTRSDMRPWTHYEMDNVHVIRLGSASASISYEVEARRKDERYEAMITSIWRKDPDSGEWKMCMHQQTPINVV